MICYNDKRVVWEVRSWAGNNSAVIRTETLPSVNWYIFLAPHSDKVVKLLICFYVTLGTSLEIEEHVSCWTTVGKIESCVEVFITSTTTRSSQIFWLSPFLGALATTPQLSFRSKAWHSVEDVLLTVLNLNVVVTQNVANPIFLFFSLSSSLMRRNFSMDKELEAKAIKNRIPWRAAVRFNIWLQVWD